MAEASGEAGWGRIGRASTRFWQRSVSTRSPARSQEEARTRLARYGKNELAAEKPAPAWQRFLGHFRDVLVILLLGAGLVSAGLWMFERKLIGAIMAAGTLLVLDGSLPGGLVDGSGTLEHGQTMALTTLTMFQLYNVFNARSDERSAFSGLLANGWLWAAVGLSLMLHAAVG